MPPSVAAEVSTWSPEVGDRVVLVYPVDWAMKDLYGECSKVHESGSFSMVTAVMGHTHFVDPDNLATHGGSFRAMNPKERYPLTKAYTSPKEKRELLAKAKAKQKIRR